MDLPAGIIVIWSGAVVNIPAGYVICDGNNGTPDLRNRFVVGQSQQYPQGSSGGSETHQHTFSDGGHTHTIPGGSIINAGDGYNVETASATASGTTDLTFHIPPYYALAYIMKT